MSVSNLQSRFRQSVCFKINASFGLAFAIACIFFVCLFVSARETKKLAERDARLPERQKLLFLIHMLH